MQIMNFLPSLNSMLVLFLLPFTVFLVFLFSKSNGSSDSKYYYPPGVKPYPILGHLPQFLMNRHRLADWIFESLAATPTKTMLFKRPGGIRDVVTADPTNVEHILRVNFDAYPKGSRTDFVLHDFLGHGIFNADHETWRHQRKTASFEFNTTSLRSFVVTCVQQEIVDRLMPLLTKASKSGSIVDLQNVLERFAFDNICKVAFNFDPSWLSGNDIDAVSKNFSTGFTFAFRDAANLSAERFRYAVPRFWMIKRFLNVGTERRLKEAISVVHGFASEIIRSRKEEKAWFLPSSNLQQATEDLLSRFISNGDHSETYLRDILISFLLAGRDTTSSALSWFFWLLSSRPDVESKILHEIKSVRGHNPTSPTPDFEQLKEMHYLRAAISESMRLYPPVPFNSTTCQADDVLPDGTVVKKGWFVSYHSYSMSRMVDNWGKDCMEYRPERWLEGDSGRFRQESPYKFTVFHGGPRMCLGKEMAYIQMKSIAACVLERFAIEVAHKEAKPQQMNSLTLRMAGGLPVRVMERVTSA